ncbi:hypothetical protein FQZ97_695080 [compost metagenome]
MAGLQASELALLGRSEVFLAKAVARQLIDLVAQGGGELSRLHGGIRQLTLLRRGLVRQRIGQVVLIQQDAADAAPDGRRRGDRPGIAGGAVAVADDQVAAAIHRRAGDAAAVIARRALERHAVRPAARGTLAQVEQTVVGGQVGEALFLLVVLLALGQRAEGVDLERRAHRAGHALPTGGQHPGALAAACRRGAGGIDGGLAGEGAQPLATRELQI